MKVILDWVVAVDSKDEICRNNLGALMEKLEEGVLSIGGRFTKKNWSSSVVYVLSGTSDGLSV